MRKSVKGEREKKERDERGKGRHARKGKKKERNARPLSIKITHKARYSLVINDDGGGNNIRCSV